MSSRSAKNAKAEARAERAKELLAAAERKRRSDNLRRGAIVGGVLAVVVAAAVLLSLRSGDEVIASPVGSSDYGLVVGELGAAHDVVIYEDFLCPLCGVFEQAAGDQLSAAAAAGDVVIDYRPISILGRFGPYSEEAHNAFLVVQDAAGDEVAKDFHDLLFDDQPAEDGPFPELDWFVEKAVEAGADEASVRPGIESGARMDDVEAATQEAENDGVRGTPTILLDGVVFSDGGNWEEIARNLIEEIS
ncbi:MAG: thioredoxin domain-containing protein [Nocardioides sp.]